MNMYPDVSRRENLPEPLRVMLKEYPHAGWAAHPNFRRLAEFWLERHVGFRHMLALLRSDAEHLIDRLISAETMAPRLSGIGNALIGYLHGHHQMEDRHYFPKLSQAEPRLERGFDMLERDHLLLDPAMGRLASAANKVLRLATDPEAARERTTELLDEIETLGRLLVRHLTDEEELVVPVLLRSGIS